MHQNDVGNESDKSLI